MIDRSLPILVWILHTSDEDLKHLKPVTRLDIMDGATYTPHPEGLFSTEIFGPFGNELRDKTFGKIDLKVTIAHPKLYRDVLALKDQYKKIVEGTLYARFDPKLGDFVAAEDDDMSAETGYGFFLRYIDQIKFVKNNSITRNSMIDEYEKWKHRIRLKNIPVMPAGLRDIEISGDGRVTKNEINDIYYRILSAASVVVKSDNMTGPEYDGIRRNIQSGVDELYEYIEGMVGGRRGFMRDKFLSRRVMDGTRNVITAMDATGVHLDSPNVPGFDSTVLGLYQTSRMLAPAMMHWLLQGPLAKFQTVGGEQVPLINKKTLEREWVDISPSVLDSYISEQGLMELIHRQEDIEARHRPIEIADHYISLVYQDEEYFKIFDSISDLPDEFKAKVKSGKAVVEPITLVEVIYYALYDKVNGHFNVNTRYPGTDDNSTYPTRIYTKTTTTARVLRELDENWKPGEGKRYLAAEWPMKGVRTYHDSHSPHSSRLGWSQADFDGDTKSSTGLMSITALKELEAYMKTRSAWITPENQMRATIVYDTSVLIMRNLTGRFNHVKSLDDKQKSKLLNHRR